MKIILILLMSLSLFASDYSSMLESFENKDTNRAIAYTRVNATNGNVNAMYNLGLLYYSKGDVKTAKFWFEGSIKNGGKGKVALSILFFSQREYKKVLELLKDVNNTNITDALIEVSEDYIQNKNDASAENYLLLGKLYFRDKIVHLDTRLALFLIDIAAKKGNGEALKIMGDAYNIMRESALKAPLQTNSLDIALGYYQQANKVGNYDAMAKMGEIYITGPRNLRKVQYGVEFIQKSANGASALGAKLLADLYLAGLDRNGLGMKLDTKKALDWYKKATDICEVNNNLLSAQDYAQYYNDCQKESSITAGYSLLFEEF